LEKSQRKRDAWEKHIYLEITKFLLLVITRKNHLMKQILGRTVRNYYWYWEVRDFWKLGCSI
jgi:hypothetical protein